MLSYQQKAVEDIKESLPEEVQKKYAHPGIYCIKVEDKVVYIGKSINMLYRISQHIYEIQQKNPTAKKYKLLHEAKEKHYTVGFDVIYYCHKTDDDEIFADIGDKEGQFIREMRPPLNYQIPKAANYHSQTINYKLKYMTLERMLSL